MKIIITGGPCSGKTSVLNELEKRGYKVVPEAAIQLIHAENEGEKRVYPWTEFDAFQKRVIEKQIENEKVYENEKLVLLDRSLIDGEGYYANRGMNPPETLPAQVKAAKYDVVFILDMLPEKYWTVNDGEHRRMQTYADGQSIHTRIIEVYERSGLKIINIPVLEPVEDRTNLIEKEIISY